MVQLGCIIIDLISLVAYIATTVMRLLPCELAGLWFSNLGSQVPPWCTWDLYSMVASQQYDTKCLIYLHCKNYHEFSFRSIEQVIKEIRNAYIIFQL